MTDKKYPKLTVVLATYESNPMKTINTLKTIVAQDYPNFNIIVTDDGSKNNNQSDIEYFFRECGFHNYSLLMHGKNQGTVKSILSAFKMSDAKYVVSISPGDYIYAANTLRHFVEFSEENDLAVACGRALYFKPNSGFKVFTRPAPYVEKPLLKSNTYSLKAVSKSQIVYCDNINAALAFSRRKETVECLEKIAGKVLYCEDYAFKMMIAQGCRLMLMPEYVVWYESGEGISTCTSGETRMDSDYQAFWEYMHTAFPNNKDVQRKYKAMNFEKHHENKTVQQINRCVHPDYFAHRMQRARATMTQKPSNYDTSFLKNLYIISSDDCQKQKSTPKKTQKRP